MLARECGECHDGGRDPLPRALRVFDVTEIEWARHMTNEQLRDAERRIGDDSAPSRHADGPRPLHVAPSERQAFHDYVDAELGARALRAGNAGKQGG